jgi:hypothetical protein
MRPLLRLALSAALALTILHAGPALAQWSTTVPATHVALPSG